MTKKLVVISSLILATAILIFISHLIKEDNKVVSTITLDVNPSVKIELNKHDKVLNISALNSDAKKIVNQTKGHNSLKDTISSLVENLSKSKFITEDNVTVLVNSNGKINIDQVSQLVISSFRKNNITASVIVQNSSDTSSKNAKRYGISEGKASYIETMIKENNNLTFDNLKDKSITELIKIRNSITEDNKPLEEENKEQNNQTPTEPEQKNNITPVEPNNKEQIVPQNNQSNPVQEEPKKDEPKQVEQSEPVVKEITPVVPQTEDKPQTNETTEPKEEPKTEEKNEDEKQPATLENNEQNETINANEE